MTLTIHNDIEQGTDEWHDLRRGVPTASVVGKLISPSTLKAANNATTRGLTATLAAERITGRTETMLMSRDMERGHLDEPLARAKYSEHFAEATETGFMTEDRFGFTLGYSPDGIVGDAGLIEIKSRKQRVQLETVLADEVPLENMAQIQCGLLVSGREWCDYVSYCGGMRLWVKRVAPSSIWFDAIVAAVEQFESNAADMIATYTARTEGLPQTEWVDHFEPLELQL